MPSLISSARRVVVHALWYLDWQTGGTTVLETEPTG
jgi:hypothetical protein